VAWAESGRQDVRVSLGEAGLGVEGFEIEFDPDGDRGAIGRGWLVIAVCESITLGWEAAGFVYARVGGVAAAI
jgi:hypothetical protein